MLTAVVLILIFGVLVAAHELGHFGVAKLMGIRVEQFGFGMGPRLVTMFRRHDTEYTIHALPIGGFVKLAGMEPDQVDIPDGFQAQATWKRALVIFAGPFMSFVLAVGAFLFVGLYWGFPDLSLPENRVGQVSPKTEAARIGLRAGDRIIAIDGIKTGRGKDMTDYIHDRAGKRLKLVVQRNGKVFERVGTPQYSVMYMGANWSFMRRDRALVTAVGKDTAAAKAGVQEDDVLVAVDGRSIRSGEAMEDAIASTGDRKVSLELLRAGKHLVVAARPDIQWVRFSGAKWAFPGGVAETGNGKIMSDTTTGKAGVRAGDVIASVNGVEKIETAEQMLSALNAKPKPVVLVSRYGSEEKTGFHPTPADMASIQTGRYTVNGLLGFVPAPSLVPAGFTESVTRGLRETGMRVAALLGMLASKDIAENVGGPVMIAKATQQSVALGPYYVFEMAGMLSLSLAVINLFPIPVLDGGHLLVMLIESIRRRRLTQQQMQTVTLAGLTTLAVLFVLVAYLDIFKITQGLAPQ